MLYLEYQERPFNKRTGIENLLIQEKIDIMMLMETDTHNLLNESSYVVQGYKTIVPIKSPEDNFVRIVCLVKECLFSSIKTRLDRMSKDFPSI